MSSLIDTHIHFNDKRFNNDRDAVYQRAVHCGVTALIVPATTSASFDSVQNVAAKYPNVHACYGLHPAFTHEHTENDLSVLESTIQQHTITAIGEIGLDGHIKSHRGQQKFYFEAQLELAKKYDLPVIIHARAAVEDVILTLRHQGPGKGVVHSYNGSLHQASRLIDLGYLLSFGGPISYPRSHKLHALIKKLPLDVIMLETDAPDQPGIAHRGCRNEPAYLMDVLESVALLRCDDKELIAHSSNNNAIKLFCLPAA